MNCICQNLTTFTGFYSGDNIVIVDGLKETTYYMVDPNIAFASGVIIGVVFALIAVFIIAVEAGK